MNLSKCERGHYYDRDRFQECPHCMASYDVINMFEKKVQNHVPLHLEHEKFWNIFGGVLVTSSIQSCWGVANQEHPTSYEQRLYSLELEKEIETEYGTVFSVIDISEDGCTILISAKKLQFTTREEYEFQSKKLLAKWEEEVSLPVCFSPTDVICTYL